MSSPDYIFKYTRQMALEDGVLIDVSEIAKEFGIKMPCALSAALFADCVFVNKPPSDEVKHMETQRMAMLFTKFALSISKNFDTDRFSFELPYFDYSINKSITATVIAALHGDDEGEPCMTMMFPSDD